MEKNKETFRVSVVNAHDQTLQAHGLMFIYSKI